MSKVFVLDTNKIPLAPTHSANARILLSKGKAAVHKQFPFTIILKHQVSSLSKGNRHLKIDPGCKTTGIAIVNQDTGEVEFAAELQHRGYKIKKDLESRRNNRRSRRYRKTRYRQPRFLNRKKPKGWLAPSLMSRIYNVDTWVKRLCKLCPINKISLELARFDTQKMQNPEISGIEYQQGKLFGYEVREYLLEKWNRKCVYCNKKDIPLEVEHIIPKSIGGSNRISNLTLACSSCNIKKGTQTAAEFGYPNIQEQANKTLRDAGIMNATRWKLYKILQLIDIPIEVSTGSQTKFNRIKQNLPKTHWLDAVCVGKSTPEKLKVDKVILLQIKATGHGSRQMCKVNKYGFPINHRTRKRFFWGFKTGDIAKAIILKGKYIGTYIGKVIVRKRPSFGFNGFDVHPKYLKKVHIADGYSYSIIGNKNGC